jgi:hypothetical protein
MSCSACCLACVHYQLTLHCSFACTCTCKRTRLPHNKASRWFSTTVLIERKTKRTVNKQMRCYCICDVQAVGIPPLNHMQGISAVISTATSPATSIPQTLVSIDKGHIWYTPCWAVLNGILQVVWQAHMATGCKSGGMIVLCTLGLLCCFLFHAL